MDWKKVVFALAVILIVVSVLAVLGLHSGHFA
jgi:hypothetical protein